MNGERSPADPDPDPWVALRALTAARIGLARAGASLATRPLLDVRLAHARARDAVQARLDAECLTREAGQLGRPVLVTRSAADGRTAYLMQPDLGRRLAEGEADRIAAEAGDHDIVFIVTDGLSARAVQEHAVPVLRHVVPALRAEGLRLAPVVVVLDGRVAIGDVVARALGAKAAVVLIGERPGLSSSDSMGAYLTWRPAIGTTDADRNCVSNIRPAGVDYAEAASKLLFLLRAMRTRGYSGVALKDESDVPAALTVPPMPPG